jgi:hypothetical protein
VTHALLCILDYIYAQHPASTRASTCVVQPALVEAVHAACSRSELLTTGTTRDGAPTTHGTETKKKKKKRVALTSLHVTCEQPK